MWFLKDALATDELGISVLELEPGGKGMEHAEADSDRKRCTTWSPGRSTSSSRTRTRR